jgi:hypothetical protein
MLHTTSFQIINMYQQSESVFRDTVTVATQRIVWIRCGFWKINNISFREYFGWIRVIFHLQNKICPFLRQGTYTFSWPFSSFQIINMYQQSESVFRDTVTVATQRIVWIRCGFWKILKISSCNSIKTFEFSILYIVKKGRF